MSVEAITWALNLKVERSSTKFVLVAMANCANYDMVCWPSIQYLCDATCQDRKTVLENIKRLKEAGLIVDENSRKGRTNQVVVYRLTPAGAESEKESQKRVPSKAPNGKEAQKRNSTENGTVPFSADNSTDFPAEESRFSAETGPKTGHGTVKESSDEPSQKRQAARGSRLPSTWTLPKSWGEWALQEQQTWTPEHVRHVAEKFRDHWVAMAGAKGLKADWPATWRNWCRNEKPLVEGKAGGQSAWWLSDGTVIAKGAELGLKPLAGESIVTFKGRIQQALDNAGKPVITQPAPAVTVRSEGPTKVEVSPENRAAALGAARALKRPGMQPDA